MITIEFYGRLTRDFEQRKIQWEGTPERIDAIFDDLCAKHQVNIDKSTIRPILNDEFSAWDVMPQAGDVVGFFPPASGG